MKLFKRSALALTLFGALISGSALVSAQQDQSYVDLETSVAVDYSAALSDLSPQEQRIYKARLKVSTIFQTILPYKVISVDLHESGLFEIVADRGIFYMNSSGEHLFSGNVHRMDQELTNTTDMKKQSIGGDVITTLGDTFVTYKAPNQLHEILVFFDTSCGFCVKMHKEMSRYNAAGITVHYALYPRSGVRTPNGDFTPSAKQLASVSCSTNSAMAMNSLVQGGRLDEPTCDDNVGEHYELGQWLGVRGTPAIYNMNGSVVTPGYVPAPRLLAILDEQKAG